MGIVIKKVLITGSTGYLGSRLLKKLLARGYDVCVVKRVDSNIQQHVDLTGNIAYYNNDKSSINRLFSDHKIDLIIHMATAYGRKGELIEEIKDTNLDFPLNILIAALAAKVPYFINTGTSLPFLTNQYALFKNQFAECLQFFDSKITTINVLLEHFYGPGDDASKFITGMIVKMLSNVEKIDLTAGTQIRDFVFIEDVLDGYMSVIDHLMEFNGFTNLPLGSGIGITIKEVVEQIKDLSESTSRLNFGAIKMRDNELMHSDADLSLLKSFGWNPKYEIKEGLRLTIMEKNEHRTKD